MRREPDPRRLIIATVLTATAALALTQGCGGSTGLRAARQGDRPALARAIATDRAAGRLDRSTLSELAEATASLDLRASDAASLEFRAQEVAPCATHVQSALESRSGTHDRGGAAAS